MISTCEQHIDRHIDPLTPNCIIYTLHHHHDIELISRFLTPSTHQPPLAIGLCNSIWPSISHDSRMSTLIIVSRFLLYLHLYCNPHLYTPMTILSRYMRSISSSRKTCIHLSSSSTQHHHHQHLSHFPSS